MNTDLLPRQESSHLILPFLCVDRRNEGFKPLVPLFYPLSCSLPAATLTLDYASLFALLNLPLSVLPIPPSICNME